VKKFLIPVALFIAIGVALGRGLFLNPTYIPSPLIGKPMPAFSLPLATTPNVDLTNADLKGHVTLLNVFASWCVSCKQEMPNLMRLHALHLVRLVGVDYKDTPKGLHHYLDAFGDPYSMIVTDKRGMTAINWGIYGVPETFVVNKQGIIAYKFVGPISYRKLHAKLIPMVKRLEAQPA
jgi:cytochrome c biogenesis protein CcmG/thiol:disulfide interchange protein DsbE